MRVMENSSMPNLNFIDFFSIALSPVQIYVVVYKFSES